MLLNPKAWIACEWLFAENCWRRLQGEIMESFVSESERWCISYTCEMKWLL